MVGAGQHPGAVTAPHALATELHPLSLQVSSGDGVPEHGGSPAASVASHSFAGGAWPGRASMPGSPDVQRSHAGDLLPRGAAHEHRSPEAQVAMLLRMLDREQQQHQCLQEVFRRLQEERGSLVAQVGVAATWAVAAVWQPCAECLLPFLGRVLTSPAPYLSPGRSANCRACKQSWRLHDSSTVWRWR